ncbi:MAG: hypothetical protein K8F91_20160 [Candidatus Obscuribacterales bacterium]|nr:hypothetical protein [Candidatus Obscuribacterales bacterium]
MSTTSNSCQLVACRACTSPLEQGAKFCGECGCGFSPQAHVPIRAKASHPVTHEHSVTHEHQRPANSATSSVPDQVSYEDLARLEAFRLAQANGVDTVWAPTPTPTHSGQDFTPNMASNQAAPSFALKGTGARKRGQIPEQLVREMQSLNALLLREQLFLIMHWCIFVISNLIGFWLAIQCYAGMHGDEVTKIVMALTPLTFINAVALACLAPIRGTKREISRIKEKMQYTRVQIEFSHLM